MNQQNAFERIAELEAKLKIATQNCEQAVKERDEAKKALSAMHRRAQAAESIIEKSGIVDSRPKTAKGRSLGRALANYAASIYMRERDELRERLAAAEAVCQLLEKSYLVLPGELDRALLAHWKAIKNKATKGEKGKT